MLERLVAWVLNNYLGKYVENLNTDQLSIAILQGEVELENLPLKKDALRHIGLPIEVRAGYVGKVKLQIPIPQFRSVPWVILIEQLCLVVSPIKLSEWDEEAETQAAHDYKLSQLDSLEARWRANTESAQVSSYYASSYSLWLSLGTNLVTNIVENLQLKIKDVHIRYEDDETVPSQAFAFGITIDSLTAQSCDDKWMPRFMGQGASKASFKLLELTALSVYCDSITVDHLLGNLSLAELVVAMSQCLAQKHQFLLFPVSAQAHIKRNKSDQPLRSKTQPRIVCDVHFEEVPISLTDWQYGQMVGCVKGLLHIDKCCRLRKYRPDVSVKESPRAWWTYAASCSVPGWKRETTVTWDRALQRAKDNVAYVDIYYKILTNPTALILPEQKILKDAIETERGYEELRSLREISMWRVRLSQTEPPSSPAPGRRTLLQWFPQLWGWNQSPPDSDVPDKELEEEILDAIADTMENNTLLRRDTVFGQFNLTLRKGAFNLCTTCKDYVATVQPVMVLQFENMVVGWESRPRSGSHKFHVALGALFLRDQLTEDTAFPVLVGPQSREPTPMLARGFRFISPGDKCEEPLFKLAYEYRPFHSSKEYKLHVVTRSLEIVYNPEAVKWLSDFFTRPHQTSDAQLRQAARHRYEAMKLRTKLELMRNWDHILEGGLNDRKLWDIELDISAPHIMFVEHFCDKNALIVVVDFGKFRFSNQQDSAPPQGPVANGSESDDEDEFQTPCSTPPGSEASLSESQTLPTTGVLKTDDLASSVTDLALHQKLYDRYTMEMGDLQILVGRVRDNWKYAHMRGTSTLHILDRFNISLQMERRIIFTSDPHFPSFTLSGNLPKLVVHVNEQKIGALRTMGALVTDRGLPSPFSSDERAREVSNETSTDPDANSWTDNHNKQIREMSRLLMLQFTIDHMSLEVQSRGRSVAELQVSGVRASYTKRPYDTSVTLSVHSLLLVDAMQTFGPDFELLVASHKHVSMDSVSGSLRDSEPTSPTSPASPDPLGPKSLRDTSPIAISQALHNLQVDTMPSFRAVSPTNIPSSPPYPTSPPGLGRPPSIALDVMDSEALIVVEVLLVSAECPSNGESKEALYMASIQFNNLDIIANQETIVELLGFTQRVFPQIKSAAKKPPISLDTSVTSPSMMDEPLGSLARTELTFDFNRLNVLLLRAVVKEGVLAGRKIGTAMLSEAKIQATVGKETVVQGSLGGLQVLDLTPEGQRHQRILSLGKDPLIDRSSLDLVHTELYTMGHSSGHLEEKRAFSFGIKRSPSVSGPDCAEIKLRMASVWYTHSSQFIKEVQSCATEFKQYLSNLARSIKTAAAEMALGLVHMRTEVLAQGLYKNTRLATSFGSGSLWEMSPRRRRKSWSLSYEQLEGMSSGTRATTPHSPHSPSVDEDFLDLIMDIRMDTVLDTPVVVLPRGPCSSQVLVAHLGKITISNSPDDEDHTNNWGVLVRKERYIIEIRDMNLYSLDTDLRVNSSLPLVPMRAEKLYSCTKDGKPILHDTMIHLVLDRNMVCQSDSVPSLLLGEDAELHKTEQHDVLHISGSVVTPLKVSLSRQQYEQLLDSIDNLLSGLSPSPMTSERRLEGISEEGDGGMTYLEMDQGLRAKLLHLGANKHKGESQPRLTLKVVFQLPVFTVELRSDLGHGEQGLVDLSFQDFCVQYDKSHSYETNIEMSLRALLMEDLLREPDSKHRCIVVSSALTKTAGPRPVVRAPEFVSKSCPNLIGHLPLSNLRGSLPDHLETEVVYGTFNTGRMRHVGKTVEYPCTPPPSPRLTGSPQRLSKEDNLVHINVTLIDRDAPNLVSHYNSVHRSVTVNFNSLDVVVNVESWVVVLDFFGIGSSSRSTEDRIHSIQQTSTAVEKSTENEIVFNSEMDVEVRSLTLVLNHPKYEVARANISHLTVRVNTRHSDQSIEGRLGSMSLMDLTHHGQLYREKFILSGLEALSFTMIRNTRPNLDSSLPFDSHLKIEMSSVLYVHTSRFVAEIQEFFHSFSRLQDVVESIRAATAGNDAPVENTRKSRLLLELRASAPVILLPVSSQSLDILVVDLGKLSVNNCFKEAGSVGTIIHSQMCENMETEQAVAPCLLDVMLINLDNMDLYAGRREPKHAQHRRKGSDMCCALELGCFCVSKQGPSLLREKCHLGLQVDRNLDTHLSHTVPDMSVRGTLSTLHGALDLSQYHIIRDLLFYNIGENIDDLPFYSSTNCDSATDHKQVGGRVWTVFSLQLDLLDVTLKLQISHGNLTTGESESSLACINFIKSRLLCENFSNRTRDIDLVSQEILITDTRFQGEPVNKRSNVFTNILQPINVSFDGDIVQAEVHHRRKPGKSKFTVLLNNMRLMSILDWWEAVRDFVLGPDAGDPTNAGTLPQTPEEVSAKTPQSPDTEEMSFELKLNITDSEIVVVEDTSQWDSNAVILKSTTVITYQPHVIDKPLCCNLNHCEMFSCVLGMEEETALSIIDPVTVNMEVSRRVTKGDVSPDKLSDRILEVQIHNLSVRLSYHDMRMFIRILNSLPKQTRWARSQDSGQDCRPANIRHQVNKLSALGFHSEDCEAALERCNGQLDNAALWLTQNAVPADCSAKDNSANQGQANLSFDIIHVNTHCLRVCVIDDCRDADVPLLELSLSQLFLEQELRGRSGRAKCVLASDYYNRVLSGWEPFIEPWRCEVSWEHGLSQALSKNRLQVVVTAQDILNLNITSTLVELYKNVKNNWTQDYYNLSTRDRNENSCSKVLGSPPGYKRRSPFVPFALRNNTGSKVSFIPIVTPTDRVFESIREVKKSLDGDELWEVVSPGETKPFTFQGSGKARHRDTHKLRLHQLNVKVDGWETITPVSVDKVGVYFRQANTEERFTTQVVGPARVVFEVTLEGSARKLVTVRSALLLNNQLEDSVEVKLDNGSLISTINRSTKYLQVSPGDVVPIPLSHVMANMFVRPINKTQHPGDGYVFCNKPILWGRVTQSGDVLEETMQCHSNKDHKYRFCTAVSRYNYPLDRPVGTVGSPLIIQPAHMITLLPPITVANLLPCDLHYTVREVGGLVGRIKPGLSTAIHQVNIESLVELNFHLDNFPQSGSLVVPPSATSSNHLFKVHDSLGRCLFLHGSVSVNKGAGIKVSVSAPFWLVNKTALPVVFRQEGVPETAAGQFEEHETARMVAPLLFSFSDSEASHTLVARVGNRLHPEGISQFCQPFHLQKGVQVRRLRVSLRDSRPDVMYEFGIDVRPGRGRYRNTNIVILSPKFQLHNKSSFQLQFAQRCFATTLTDPRAQATFLTAVPDCCLAFHWPRLDKDQQLCLRLVDVPGCMWSGGFLIDSNDSRHINVRDGVAKMYFLRVEVVLQGATYLIVFTDADTIPPPLRIDNFSEVPLIFFQSCVPVESLQTVVRPHSSMPYAWDEPTQAHSVTLMAPGGVLATYDMTYLEKSGDACEGQSLTYENFIYIAFTSTFLNAAEGSDVRCTPLELEGQQLVLDVPPGSSRVVLSHKVPGARGQLWRMTGEGQLQHEGSGPPRDPRSKYTSHPNALVLDIAGPAPQPLQYVHLVLRRKDQRRTSTQTWRFTEEGRLCCMHNNMCVQARDGFFGLRQGSEAVLGPPQPVCHRMAPTGIPVEQAVSRQKLRPGSGFLAVKMLTDGPTCVLHIADLKEKPAYLVMEDRDWGNLSTSLRPPLVQEGTLRAPASNGRELQVTVDLPCGVGVSLVSQRPPEELLFLHLTGIMAEYVSTSVVETVSISVQHVQCDNQLFEAQCPVVMYVTPPSVKSSKDMQPRFLPAISLSAERILTGCTLNCENFKYLIVTMKNLTVTIEELLLLKLFAFAGYNHLRPEQMDVDESEFEVQRLLTEATSVHAKKYYFGTLKLEPGQVRLSVVTTNKLPAQLQSIKRKLNLTLIKFEDANVDLKPFIKSHPFESGHFFIHSILKKYKDELKWQAAFILGSVDFLGSPLGLMSDVAEGVSGFIYDGNVHTLVQNVSYGISNSAAKVTESLSDGLGRMTMDKKHEEKRQRIRKLHTGSGGDHLVAGLKGLGIGIMGGFTSVFKQTYEGAINEGIQGILSGFGKGLVGTVTKPVVGVLDLASETASAVRDSSRSAKHLTPGRFRPPRCVLGTGGLMPHYSKKQSQGQEFLYIINNQDYSELFIAYEYLRSGSDDLRVLISSERVRVFTVSSSANCCVVIETHLCDLLHCQTVSPEEESGVSGGGNRHYIELTMKLSEPPTSSQERIKRPRIRCDNETIAKWVSQQVNYAKKMFEQRTNTLIIIGDNIFED